MRYVIETYSVYPVKKKPVWPWVIFWIFVIAVICGSDDKKKQSQNVPVQNEAPSEVANGR